MKIAIDCRSILNPKGGERAGVGHYTYEIVRALLKVDQDNQYVLFFNFTPEQTFLNDLIETKSGVEIKVYKSDSHLHRSWAIKQSQPDLLFVPTHEVPRYYRGRTVIIVHDLAIVRNPEWFRVAWWRRALSLQLLKLTLRRVDQVIVPSQSTATDLCKYMKVPKTKITVVPHGVQIRETISQKRQSFFFCLATIEPRKNYLNLLKAFDQFLDHDTRYRLLIAGAKGWDDQAVFDHLGKINQKWSIKLGHEPVEYLGYVSDDQKWQLLQKATAFVYPSFYEGFGMPVLEAMSVGTPVIASNTSSLPEVGGEAVRYVDPNSVQGITQAMFELAEVVTNQKYAELGRIRVKSFTWAAAAQKTLQAINQKHN